MRIAELDHQLEEQRQSSETGPVAHSRDDGSSSTGTSSKQYVCSLCARGFCFCVCVCGAVRDVCAVCMLPSHLCTHERVVDDVSCAF